MNKIRFACVIIPNYRIAVLVKQEPSLAAVPLALTEQPTESALIVALNESAMQDDVTVGMTAAQGHSRCPDLAIRLRDVAGEKQLSESILAPLQGLSPFVEELSEGVYALDASGLQYVYRSEHEFAEKIAATTKAQGVPVTVGIAGNKFIAQAAAILAATDTIRIILPGTEREFLKPLSIEHLPLSEETRERLHDLGLRTMGQLTTFPANELIERFGAEGLMLSQLVRGEDPAFFLPELPGEQLCRKVSLTFATSDAATIMFHVERLLQNLLECLQIAGRTTGNVVTTYHLEDKSDKALRITLDQPALSAKPFIRQLRVKMERVKLLSGVMEITVTIPQTSPLILEQLEFQKKAVGRTTFTHNADNIAAMPVGHALYAPELVAAHLPEKNFRLVPLTASQKTKPPSLSGAVPHTYSRHRLSGLRLLQPPQPTDVVITNGKPTMLTVKRKLRPIEQQLGPWKLSGGWWSADFDRYYYEMQTTDRQLYLVFYDRLASRWFLQGVFD